VPSSYSVKEAVFPFIKFPGVDPILGPEMKSTGEVMGIGYVFGEAYAKSQLAAGVELPSRGRVFISVRDADKPALAAIGRDLVRKGFELVATPGTAGVLHDNGIECALINKVAEGRPHVVDAIKNSEIDLIINTTEGRQAIADSFSIRREALHQKVCYTTTVAGARATCQALDFLGSTDVRSLQDLHKEARA
jgi:carbamoyl-phosphate synthase large subunit